MVALLADNGAHDDRQSSAAAAWALVERRAPVRVVLLALRAEQDLLAFDHSPLPRRRAAHGIRLNALAAIAGHRPIFSHQAPCNTVRCAERTVLEGDDCFGAEEGLELGVEAVGRVDVVLAAEPQHGRTAGGIEMEEDLRRAGVARQHLLQ